MSRESKFALRLAGSSIALAVVAISSPAFAQSTEFNDTPIGDHTGKDVATVSGDFPNYVIPDFPPAQKPLFDEEAHFLTIKANVALIGDFTGFIQDDQSVFQDGVKEDEFNVRSARLTLSGTIGTDYKVNYQVAGEFKGFDGDPDTTWSWTDVNMSFPLWKGGKLTLGKTKETFSYEMVGDSANLPHSERVLNPFFVSRNMGARFIQVLGPDKRATVSFGVYKDDWDIQSTTDRGIDVTARITMVPWANVDKKQFLHLGAAYRHVATDGTIRYRGRAETNVGENVIDTGAFPASHADHYAAEALLNIGPVSFLGEYILAKVDSPSEGDPEFQGMYITASWILTGETRPYDRNVGYARRVMPKGRWGAPELIARYSHVDLDDNEIFGGSYDMATVGLNWWATTRWKFGATWGHTWLDRFGVVGESDTVLTRIQYIY